MAITSKVEICNMALSHLGNYGTISNIDTPANDKERTFSLWYDITRQMLLKQTMPNFAQARRIVGEVSTSLPFGYSNAFEYPNDCLKVLGLGNIEDKGNYNYTIESDGTRTIIITEDEWATGLEIRFIRDVTDVNLFSPEFKILLSWVLASNVAMDITQDISKKNGIEGLIPQKMLELSGINAQENKPIRITKSLFKEARYGTPSRSGSKK